MQSKFRASLVPLCAVLLWCVASERASADPSLNLSGGTMLQTCFQGNCFWNRWFCVDPPQGDFELSVNGADANSTVNLLVYSMYVCGQGCTYWGLDDEYEIGTTDGSGNFSSTTDPPESNNLGANKVYVVINDQYSNQAEYRLGTGSPPCP